MTICSVEGCGKKVHTIKCGLCCMHYSRLKRYGRLHLIRGENGTGTLDSAGYRQITINGVRVKEHIFLAEKAVGKLLPAGAVVHHMNEDRSDNHTPFNLIICPDRSYHALLHQRAREYEKYGKCYSTYYDYKRGGWY